jgi:hypothetical protein
MQTTRPGKQAERCEEMAKNSVKYVLLLQLDD